MFSSTPEKNASSVACHSELVLRMVAEPGSRWNRAAALLILSILTFFLQTTVMTAVPTLIDTKLLGRPNGYSGNRCEWNQFKFVFKAYVVAISTEMLRHLDTAARIMNAIPLSAFTAAEQKKHGL
jgi:hypothetical protein